MSDSPQSLDPLVPDDAPPSIYGPDGAPQFFQDPAMDRFVAVILNLASELWVQTERVDTLTRIIEQQGLTLPKPAATDPQRDFQLSAYIHRVLSPLREPQ